MEDYVLNSVNNSVNDRPNERSGTRLMTKRLRVPQNRWNGLRRVAWAALAWLCIGLGAIGIFLPLLPTTPFLLVAAWAAPKASPALHRWLHTHPQFGPVLRAWRDERAVPSVAKATAGIMLILSWSLMFWLQVSTFVLVLTAVLFTGVLTFLLTRPAPRGTHYE